MKNFKKFCVENVNSLFNANYTKLLGQGLCKAETQPKFNSQLCFSEDYLGRDNNCLQQFPPDKGEVKWQIFAKTLRNC